MYLNCSYTEDNSTSIMDLFPNKCPYTNMPTKSRYTNITLSVLRYLILVCCGPLMRFLDDILYSYTYLHAHILNVIHTVFLCMTKFKEILK